MPNYQKILLDWIAGQSGLTGLVVLGAGLLFAFFGFRVVRLLLVLLLAGLAYWGAAVLAPMMELPQMIVSVAAAVVCGAMVLAWPKQAAILAHAVTWAGAGAYLARQCGLNPPWLWVVLGLSGCAGLVLGLLSRRFMAVLLTSLHGSALVLLGFVGIATAVLPAVGETVRRFAGGQSLLLPVLVAMVATTGYSYQAMVQRGDMRMGGQAGLNRVPGD